MTCWIGVSSGRKDGDDGLDLTLHPPDLLLPTRFGPPTFLTPHGGVAQLVERFHGMEEVVSSSLIASTSRE